MLLSRAQEANGGGRINQEGEKASAAATLQGLQLIIKNNKRKRLVAMTKQASIRIADVVVVVVVWRAAIIKKKETSNDFSGHEEQCLESSPACSSSTIMAAALLLHCCGRYMHYFTAADLLIVFISAAHDYATKAVASTLVASSLPPAAPDAITIISSLQREMMSSASESRVNEKMLNHYSVMDLSVTTRKYVYYCTLTIMMS